MSMREYEVKGIDNTQRTTIRLDLLIGSNVSVVSDKFPPIARHIQVIYFGGKIIYKNR